MELPNMYVLRKTGTENNFYRNACIGTKSLEYAKKFKNSNDAIDFMLERRLLDTYDLVNTNDLKKERQFYPTIYDAPILIGP